MRRAFPTEDSIHKANTTGMAKSMIACPFVGPMVNWYEQDGLDKDVMNSAYVVWSTKAVSTSTTARMEPENVALN